MSNPDHPGLQVRAVNLPRVKKRPDGTLVIEIHTSDRNSFRGCRERWNYVSPIRMAFSYNGGIPALDLGTAVHKGLEVYYEPKGLRLEEPLVQESLALTAFWEECEEQRDRIKEALGERTFGEEQEEQLNEQYAMGDAMLRHYFLWAPRNDYDWEPTHSEISFDVNIPCEPEMVPERFYQLGICIEVVDGENVLAYDHPDYGICLITYSGRIDAIMRRLSDNTLWIWDHKTAAQFQDNMEWLNMDPQCGSYYWALRRVLGIDVTGVIYNQLKKWVPEEPEVLKNGNLSQNKNKKVSYDTYKAKLEELGHDVTFYADFLQYLQEHKKAFRRVEVFRSEAELRLLENTIAIEAMEMVASPLIYPNPGPFNCPSCAFKGPCQARHDGSDWLWMLRDSTLYRQQAIEVPT